MKKLCLLSLALASLSIVATGHSSAATIAEDFSTDPATRAWRVFGDASLFQWDSTNQNLRVTWNSSQPNSFFYHPLGTILTKDDDLSLAFDLRLDDIGPGLDTNKDTSFPIAIGFLSLDEATQTNFLRGTGYNSPDLAEFAYFWDSGYGATDWPTLVDTNSSFNYTSSSDFAILALTPGDWYRIVMTYTASNRTVVTTLTNRLNFSGLVITTPIDTNGFTDYRLGTLAISSYSDAGQDPQYAGSVLAHGAVDNIVVTMPPPPAQNFTGTLTSGIFQGQFLSRSNWFYTLERTADFRSWTGVDSTTGNATNLFLQDPTPPLGKAFYRVRAQRH